MPKTYLTPSASRHSTNRSDALRELNCPQLLPTPVCPANLDGARPDPMTRTLLRHAGAAAGARRARAAAAPEDHVHDPRRRLRPRRRDEPVRRDGLRPARLERGRRSSPTTTRAPRSGRPTRTAKVRIQLVAETSRRARITGARQAGSRKLDPAVTYTRQAPRAHAGRPVGAAASGSRRSPRRCRSRAHGGVTALGGIGSYRGVLEFAPTVFKGLSVTNVGRRSTTTCRASSRPSRPPRGRPRRCKAQAIAARTYAITTAKSADFDHYADTRSQVYKGVGIETAVDQRGGRRHPRADRHLPGPAGRHLLLLDLRRQDRGRSRTRRWATSRRPWLESVEDEFDDVSPRHRWTTQADDGVGGAQARRRSSRARSRASA